MEGNSSDSVSSRSGASFSPRSTPFAGELTAIVATSRSRSVAESELAFDSTPASIEQKSEIGDDSSYGIDVAERGGLETAFSTPAIMNAERTFSPLRRGPGRPRKDASARVSARGKTQATKVRGGRRMRSQFTGRQLAIAQQNIGFAALSGATSGQQSPPPAGPSACYGEVGSAIEEQTPLFSDSSINKNQRCAFCYLTQSSRLGQGDLVRHSPTPGFSVSSSSKKPPPRSLSPPTSAETQSLPGQESVEQFASSTEQLTLRINLKHSKVVRIQKKADVGKDEQEPYDEIDKLGLPDDIELTDLFESTGHCWAHHCCASWSDGVVQSDTFALLHVDSAAAAAMTQKCAGCSRMGASITCRVDGCGRKYHYPCASAYGGFQDIKTLAFLCPYHLDDVPTLPDANAGCGKCEAIGDIASQLFCTSCGDHYHADCLEPAVGTTVTVRAGWQCPECKMCQHCQRYGDDSRMLVCDSCDKGYHVYCMQPPMTTIPKSGWKCKNCRICTDCGSRTPGSGPSSRWHLNYSICDSCYQQRNKGLFCPLCERAYRHLKLKSMRQCSRCKKYVHLDCIRKSLPSSASETSLSSLVSINATDYVCPICQTGEGAVPGHALSPSHSHPILSHLQQHQFVANEPATTPSSSVSMEENEEAEAEMLAIFMKNEMAGGGESLSGTESPFLELDALGDMDVDGVMQLLQPEETGDLASDVCLPASALESKRGRGGGVAAGLKKQAALPRKRISAYGRTAARTKSSSCSSSVTGSVRGGGNAGDKRRMSKSGGGGGRGGGQRAAITALQATLQNMISSHNSGCATRKKEDDEYIHTVVVSSNDEFVFCQDICVICGSFGKGAEGYFIACTQCGQCYHPYCANITINAAILRRGWRCLDCTVCEGCGRGDDEQHLLLCDDCDISFHTYCLDPPLDTIPAGPWVCKWCSSCQVCGATLRLGEVAVSPSKICSRCESVIACPLCRAKYADGEYIIQCESCERWCHCKCDGLSNEEAIDKAADKGFKCWFCRPTALGGTNVQEPLEGRGTGGSGKTMDLSFHMVMDGVPLTKTGLRTIQWRPRRKPTAPSISTTSMSALDDVIDSVHAFVTRGLDEHGATPVEDQPTEQKTEPTDMERLNVDTSAGGENCAPADPSLLSPLDKKKLSRTKKFFKVGLGGFLVRHTRQRSLNDKPDDFQDSQDIAADTMPNEDGRESATGDASTPVEKPKKRKRQNKQKQSKIQLEDNYPSYIQEAFFGNSSADVRSNVDDRKAIEQAHLDEQDTPLVQARFTADNELESVAPPPVVKASNDNRRGDTGVNEHHGQSKLVQHGPSAAMVQQGLAARRQSACTHQQDPIGEGFDELGEGDDIFPHPIDIHQHEFSNLIDMLMGEGDMDPVGGEDGAHPHSPNLENLIDSRDYVGIGEVDTAEMDRLMGNMLDDELRGACDADAAGRQQIGASHHHSQQQAQQHAQSVQHCQGSMVQNQSVIAPSVYHHHQQQPPAPHYVHEQVQQFVPQPLEHEQPPPHHPYGVNLAAMQHQMQPHEMVDSGQDPSRFLSTPQQPQTAPPTPSLSMQHEFIAAVPPPPATPCHSTLSPKGEAGSSADGKSYLERWEPDESLGDKATIAAVLYANRNYPDLRMKYPAWTERAKQIAKLWRLLPPESRQQYVQMARENRAACRQMNKSKKAAGDQSQHASVSSSPDVHSIDRSVFPQPGLDNAPQLQSRDPRTDVTSDPSSAFKGAFGGPAVLPQPYVGANHPNVMSRMDGFKVPQRPPSGVSYRPDVLKRCDSQPHVATDFMEEHQIKTEPYAPPQTPSIGADQSAGAGGNHGPYTPYSMPPGAFEQQYANQSPAWDRCQPSLLEDFIEMERRDQRSRQPGVPLLKSEPVAGLMDGVGQWPAQQMVPPGANQPMALCSPEVPLQRQRPVMRDAGGESVPSIPRDQQHEEWLSRTQREYEVRMKAVEAELNQLRKSKKNMAAKQRQLKKNNLELTPDDAAYLARLGQDISERQKQLEQLRKQVKQHNNLVQDYNLKHGLAPPTPNAPRPQGPLMGVSPMVPPGAPQMRPGCGMEAFESFQQFGRPPSAAPGAPFHAHLAGPAGLPVQQRIAHPEPGQFPDFGRADTAVGPIHAPQHPDPHQTGPRQNVVYIGHQPSAISPMAMAFPSVASASSAASMMCPQQAPAPATEQKKKKKYYSKKKTDKGAQGKDAASRDGGDKGVKEPEAQSPCPQSNLLAMAPDYDVDVVVTVSLLLDKTVAEVDGPSAATATERENVLLKRLLDSSPPAGAAGSDDGKKGKQKEQAQGGKRPGQFASGQGSPKKRQRKVGNTVTGSAAGSKAKAGVACSQTAANAHAVFLEQLAIQLKTLPPVPIQEPAPKSDPLISNNFGISNLIPRAEKPFVTGSGPGHMRLTFMPDYYLDVFDNPLKLQEQQYQLCQSRPQSFINAPVSLPTGYDAGSKRQLMNLQQHQVQPSSFTRPRTAGSMLGMEGCPGQGPVGLPRHTYGSGPAGEHEIRSLMESPLEVIYSDAPEYEEDLLPTYPALKPVMPAEGRLSPNFRLVAPVPMRAVPADPPTFFDQVIPPSSSVETTLLPRNEESELVDVTLTLNMDAAQRVHEVLRGLADLLQIDVPHQFEVHIDTPPQTPEKAMSKISMEMMEYRQSSATICRNCESAVQQACVRKRLAELGLTPKEDDADEVIFCSQHCYDQFTNRLKVRAADSQDFATECIDENVKPFIGDVNRSTSNAAVNDSTAASAPSMDQQETAPKQIAGAELNEESRLDEIIKSVLGDTNTKPPYGSKEELFHVKDLPKFKDGFIDDGSRSQPYEKRWKGSKWKSWSVGIGDNVLAVVAKSTEAMYMEASRCLFRPPSLSSDTRVCDFCATVGDGPLEITGRLLNLDAGRWVHVNCALWSAEVYERVEGALVNVEQAVRRSSSDVCSCCQRYGASVPCYKLRCDKNYHLPCAVQSGCIFLKDKTMLCPIHAPGTGPEVVLTSLAVIRRVYVERDENRIIAKLYQQGDSGELSLRVGSLIFGHVGQLLPHQLRNFHSKDFIYPAGYTARRIYWSSKDTCRRNMYMCTISDHDGQPEFNVAYHEEDFADVAYTDSSASGAWSGILRPLEQMRVESGMLKLFSDYLSGEVLFGLTESAIVKMIESLPGVDMMLRYECKYGRSPLIDLPLAVNPSGCARCEPRFRTYIKRSHTHTASTSGSFQNLLALSGLSTELAFYQYAGNRQTLVSKWSQYRKMKQEWQSNVYLARSKIQGLGLYAKRDIEMNAMVIEYIGEVIRNEVAERREKQYQQHNRGIYMFRIDEERVIDATVSGGLARYINHSCDPNCVAELFEFDREPKIIIMSCRPITKGEELTYDYQFDVEDDISKIPCLCGAPNCQKWMN